MLRLRNYFILFTLDTCKSASVGYVFENITGSQEKAGNPLRFPARWCRRWAAGILVLKVRVRVAR